jgi:hypothetical protein
MLWMSALELAVGLDEPLDPPSAAHPISSNEKEQTETNLRNANEVGDCMETPGTLVFFCAQTRPKLQVRYCWFFRGCPSCWI